MLARVAREHKRQFSLASVQDSSGVASFRDDGTSFHTTNRYSSHRRALSVATATSDASSGTALSLLASPSMDLRRFDTIVHAGPMDFQENSLVQEVPNLDLDWSTTIFYTITDPDLTARLQARFGTRTLWPDAVLREACQTAVDLQLPAQQYTVPPEVLEFMRRECTFKNEHAEGSFMDHLDFCAEYTARYFKTNNTTTKTNTASTKNASQPMIEASPNVLFLHSICGVNTNLFPLEFDKIPDMQDFLTPHEYLHVQAFPCMLRLLWVEHGLLDALWDKAAAAAPEREAMLLADKLQGVTVNTFHGTQLTLEGDELWMHLNYHLIHLLDFMPTQHYEKFAIQDGFTRLFLRMHEFLRTQDRLWATVRLDRIGQVPGMTAPDQELPTWEHLTSSQANKDDAAKVHAQLGKQLRAYSEAIGHDLSYELHWK